MQSFRYHYLTLGVVASFSLAQPATAQEHKDDSTHPALMDEVVIYGDGYRTTGTKSQLMPMEAPMSYEIYDSELLALRQADTVNQALRYVTGITPESRATVTIFDQYTIRGFQSYRNFYDGLPLQYNGLWNLAPQVDVFATQGVEVLKGPTSVLYGSAPPGGMINQTAKQPLGDPATQVRVRTGSHDLAELGVDSTGPLTDDLDYRMIALFRQQDGQQKTTEEERRLLAPSLTWHMSDSTSLNLNLYYQDDPKLTPSTPLPALGTVHRASYGWLDADAYAGDRNWGGVDRTITMAGYKFNHAFTDDLTFLQNFRYTEGELFQENSYNNGLADDGRTLLRSAYFTDEDQEGFVVDNQLAWNLNTAAVEHRLLLGAEYRTLDADIHYGDTLGFDTPSLDLGNPDHDQFDPSALPFDSYTEKHAIEQDQLGIYLQDEIRWRNLTVVAGARWDSYESEDQARISYLGSPASSTTEIDQEEVTARASAMYHFDNGLSPYINYSESFEPTSGVNSLTGEPFEPTTANQIEAGVKYSDYRTNVTFAWFDLRKENVVVNTPDFLERTQTGEVGSEGVELNVDTRLTERLALTANYTWLDVEVLDNPLDPSRVGNNPVWVADQQASLWASFQATEALSLSGGVRYVGESAMDAANTDTVPSYTLADLAIDWQINPVYRVALSVNNVFDETYVGACFDASNCWMGIERSTELTLSARF